ncbi:Proline-, glutamic acid- and leucine-rich protein 1, partial [Orchesella cincta]
DFKLQLYRTLISWLVTTGGVVTNLKTMSAWVDVMGNDTRVEKDVVELKILSKSKAGKSVKLKLMSSSSLPLGATTTLTFVQKNANVCKLALVSLARIIPSLDGPNHRKVYEHLIKTAAVINQFQTPPSPYDNAYCRKLIYENLSCLLQNPHPRSPVTVSLIASLFRKGMQDPTTLVSSFCLTQISTIERLMHPISAPLSLAGPSAVPVALDNSNHNSVNARIANSVASASEDSEMEEENIQIDTNTDTQLDKELNTNQSQVDSSNKTTTGGPVLVDPHQLKQIVKDVFLESFRNGTSTNVSQAQQLAKPSYFENMNRKINEVLPASQKNSQIAPPSRNNESEVVELDDDSSVEEIELDQIQTNGIGHHENESMIPSETEIEGNSKRKVSESENEEMQNIDIQVKKVKTSTPIKTTEQDGPSVEEMLTSFIDLEPTA